MPPNFPDFQEVWVQPAHKRDTVWSGQQSKTGAAPALPTIPLAHRPSHQVEPAVLQASCQTLGSEPDPKSTGPNPHKPCLQFPDLTELWRMGKARWSPVLQPCWPHPQQRLFLGFICYHQNGLFMNPSGKTKSRQLGGSSYHRCVLAGSLHFPQL